MASDSNGSATENAYEKLSREVHQMQITGAIHNDWLENPKGFLLKPDFKRKLQLFGAGGKKLQSNVRGLRIHLPGNSYRTRWFVLDGMVLRYFKNNTEDQELGAIHLASVNAVLPSSVADAPEHALDLVCADRIYTVAGTNREDMVRWATVLTLVLRGEYKPKLMQRPESTIIRGSSVIPRPTAMSRKTTQVQSTRFTDASALRLFDEVNDQQSSRDEQLNEKIVTVTFDQPGPLYLVLRGTVEDEVMVCGFQTSNDGLPGPAEASGAIRVGDLLISVNNYYFTSVEFKHAINLIKTSERPLTLRFSRIDSRPMTETSRNAEGWVLAKEPAAHRYRIRMLQLYGDLLKLYKPSMQNGRADKPCLTMRMEDVTDIRPTKDTREVVSALTQCHPKQWGITLEGSQSIFTFYTKSYADLVQWIDVLKNSPLFTPKSTRSSIPVHAISTVEFDPILAPVALLEDEIWKRGDLVQTYALYQFALHDDGKIRYYISTSHIGNNQVKPIGSLRCDCIASIVPSHISDTDMNIGEGREGTPWRLELSVLVTCHSQKFRRPITICFETRNKMLKWAVAIAREAKRLTGQDFDLSITRRYSRSNSRSSDLSLLRADLSKLASGHDSLPVPNNMYSTCPLYRSLRDATSRGASTAWFYVKKPREYGLDAYHPRYVVIKEHQLLFYKYEIQNEESLPRGICALDLRIIKDVREADSEFQENLDFTIQLTTADDIVWMLVAGTYSQKELWLATLIWLSDYHYRAGNEGSSPEKKEKHGVESTSEATGSIHASTMVQSSSTDDFYVSSDSCAEIRGWLYISGKKVYAEIARGVFCYYARKEDLLDPWGDVLDAISLKSIQEVRSEDSTGGRFIVKVKGETEVQLVAENNEIAKKWMLVMCSCGDLILKKLSHGDAWASTQPKEAWIWKLDRLYQVFRRRYFSLRNHQLIFFTEGGGRLLGIVSLSSVFSIIMSKVCTRSKDEADFYQLEISFAIPTAEENSNVDEVGDFYALTMAFDTETDLKDWANAIYDCCTNSMSLKANVDLPPLADVQILPKELLKTCRFDSGKVKLPDSHGYLQNEFEFNSRGWLYYRTSTEERIRLRYFVQWGFELSIYKHDILADEQGAIRYGVIDCRALVDVRFACINCPENAVELVMASDVSVIIIPRTDEEAVMWRNSLLDAKRAYGYLESGKEKEILGSGIFISRGSTFSAQKDNEELLRLQIEACVVHSANLQDWDGRKWIPKYFVLTTSRVLILSLAVHLYDEEPDILGSFATKDILEVRSCNESEEAETGNTKTAFVVSLHTYRKPIELSNPLSDSSVSTQIENVIIRCDSFDNCLEWMRMLCNSNGKLELKKNAATGFWGSINRVATMSRHQSFLYKSVNTTALASTSSVGGSAATPALSMALGSQLSMTAASSGNDGTQTRGRRMSRQDAARRRTSELLMSRKVAPQ